MQKGAGSPEHMATSYPQDISETGKTKKKWITSFFYACPHWTQKNIVLTAFTSTCFIVTFRAHRVPSLPLRFLWPRNISSSEREISFPAWSPNPVFARRFCFVIDNTWTAPALCSELLIRYFSRDDGPFYFCVREQCLFAQQLICLCLCRWEFNFSRNLFVRFRFRCCQRQHHLHICVICL